MKASLTNYRQAPRKVRLLADLVRGKSVSSALLELDFADKRAALPLKKLIDSAVANAETNFDTRKENLFIKEIRVDKGLVMKRSLPRARGRATPINHRTSHINVVLGTKEDKTPVVVEAKVKATTKKDKTAKPKAIKK